MTANVLPQQVAGLKTSGMDGHVGKPFRRPELLDTIRRWTRSDAQAIIDVETPTSAAKYPRFDRDAFLGLEDIIGETPFRVYVAKFAADLSTRFQDVGPTSDRGRLAEEAHTMIQAVGLFGFTRLLSIIQKLNEGVSAEEWTDTLGHELEAERKLTLADIDRYLATAGRRMTGVGPGSPPKR